MDRSVFSFIEPLLHNVSFMGWNFAFDRFHQPVFDNNYGNVIICFQIAYGVGFLIAGRVIDKLGTKTGYAVAIAIWAISSMSHSLVTSVLGFCIARIFLGLGESGNFPAAIKGVSEWFPTEERGKAVGLFNSGSNVSFFLAPLLIGFASGHWGWRASFIATGSLGVLWLIGWMLFPYNRLRRGSTQTQANLTADFASQTQYGGNIPLLVLLQRPGAYAFAIGKGLTDGVWWFYLFYLPQFLNRNYGLDLVHAYWEIVTVYVISSVGSIFGGSLSGLLMKHGYSVNGGRKIAMLSMAVCVLPLVLVPHMGSLFPANPWPATLLIALAAAAHQGWSANLSQLRATCSRPPPFRLSSASAAQPEQLAERASRGWSSAISRCTPCWSSRWPREHTSWRSHASTCWFPGWASRPNRRPKPESRGKRDTLPHESLMNSKQP